MTGVTAPDMTHLQHTTCTAPERHAQRFDGLDDAPRPIAQAAGQAEVWRLLHHPRSVAAARTIARRHLANWHLHQQVLDDALAITSELVTNAVTHGTPPVILCFLREESGRTLVAVSDGGPAEQSAEWASGYDPDEHGRGISIVEHLAFDQGSLNSYGFTTYWARLKACEGSAEHAPLTLTPH